MSQLIVLIDNKKKQFHLQINGTEDYSLQTFNISFDLAAEQYTTIKGFSIPCLSSYPCFDIYGDQDTGTINKLSKALPKIKEASATVPEFIQALAKKYKVKAYQININSCFDDSAAKPWSVAAIVDISGELKNSGFSLNF